MVLTLLKAPDLDSKEFPKLKEWYRKMATIREVSVMEKKFKEIVSTYNFA